MQTGISLIFILWTALTTYGYLEGNFGYALGGTAFLVAMVLWALYSDLHDRKRGAK